jgi:hypothetical protein
MSTKSVVDHPWFRHVGFSLFSSSQNFLELTTFALGGDGLRETEFTGYIGEVEGSILYCQSMLGSPMLT